MKKQSGITLVALVITIIILLLLAGIAIVQLQGQDGILSKTSEAKKTYNLAQMKEDVELTFMESTINSYTGEVTESTLVELFENKGYTYTPESGIIVKNGTDYAIQVDPETHAFIRVIDLSTYEPSATMIADNYNGETEKQEVVDGVILDINVSSIKEGLEYVKLISVINEETETEDLCGEKYSYVSKMSIYKNGTYTLQAKIKNGELIEKTITITQIDEEVPEIVISKSTEEYTKQLTLTITATGTTYKTITGIKDPEGNSLTLTDGTNTSQKVAEYLVDKNGTYEFTVIYKNVSGQDKEMPAVEEVTKIDSDAPTMEITPNTIAVGQESVIITVKAEDTQSGVAKLVKCDAEGNNETALTGLTDITNGKQGTFTATENGKYYFKSVDNAENSKISEIEITNIVNTWEYLNQVAKAISNDSSITNTSQSATVNVNGEDKTLNVGNIYTVQYNGTPYSVRILGFNHDELSDTTKETAYGESTVTGKAGISFEFVDCLLNTQLHSSNSTNSGGWGSCTLRTNLNSIHLNEMSNVSYIKEVKKLYKLNYAARTSSTSNDKLWILSLMEILRTG